MHSTAIRYSCSRARHCYQVTGDFNALVASGGVPWIESKSYMKPVRFWFERRYIAYPRPSHLSQTPFMKTEVRTNHGGESSNGTKDFEKAHKFSPSCLRYWL